MRGLERVLSPASHHGGIDPSPALVAAAHQPQLSVQGTVALKVHNWVRSEHRTTFVYANEPPCFHLT